MLFMKFQNTMIFMNFGGETFPKETGKTIFNLFEIYKTEDTLHRHQTETALMADVMNEMAETHDIERVCFNQMKVCQSHWD